MKKYLMLLASAVIMISAVSCSAKKEVTFPSVDNTNLSLQATVNSEVIPKSFDDMKDKAENIVLCTVVNDEKSDTFESGLTLSYSDVKVEKVYKGDVNTGDILTVSETGERRENGDTSIDGVPLLRKNNKVLLFLKEKSETGRYGIVANYYGKFYLDENNKVYPSSYFSNGAGKISDFTEPELFDIVQEKL